MGFQQEVKMVNVSKTLLDVLEWKQGSCLEYVDVKVDLDQGRVCIEIVILDCRPKRVRLNFGHNHRYYSSSGRYGGRYISFRHQGVGSRCRPVSHRLDRPIEKRGRRHHPV